MNKLKLIIILCFVILKSDEITSSCKDYKYEECMSKNWKAENSDQEKALENYIKARDYINENKFLKSYEHIVKARDIISGDNVLDMKMKKNIYSGSALRPRVKTYKTEIKNIYDIESLETNVSSKNTALPFLIVECSKNESNIHLYNINKSIKNNQKITNMDLANIEVLINNESYKIDNIKSGDKGSKKIDIDKCKELSTSLNAVNSLFEEKSIAKVKLFKKGL